MRRILLITFFIFCGLLSGSLFGQTYIEDTYNAGMKQFQDGDYKSAITSFDLVISTATKKDKDLCAKAHLSKADSLLEILDLDSALKEYGLITEKFPNTNESLKARLGIGLVYYKKNDYDRTREYFINFVKRYGGTKIVDDAQYWLGMLHFKNKNFKKAAVSFTALVQNYPKSNYAAEGWLRLGDCYYELKKYKSARNSYRSILTKYSDSPQAEFALYNIGRTYEAEGSISDYIAIYVQFAEKYPKSQISPEILSQIGEYFYKKKDYDKSAKYFEMLFTNFPDNDLAENAQFIRSKIYYKNGARTEAINSFSKFLEKYPLSKNCAEALLYLGNCYLDAADYQKAIEYYEKGLKGEPAESEISAMMRYNCGQAYEKVGNLIEAEKCFSEILYRYPKSIAAAKMYLKRGVDLERSGDYFAAVENYELAATIAKNKNIQKSDSLSNNLEEEVGALAQKKAADCYFMQKKFKEASREYLKVVYLFSDSELVPEAHYMSARASEEIGYIKEAKENYEIVKKKYADTDWAKKSEERLQELSKK
ncbi:MAG: tetratricopeptide repeat protein [Elusimicrobia bacterium]|nr:tetratricopeptide repeat protein [Elusimicrobiota bacterium]